MKLYLSAQWARRREMHDTAIVLRSDGHEVVSRWHDELMGDDNASHEENWRAWALACFDDIRAADAFVAFTEEVGTDSRGGRHVEWGYALAIAGLGTYAFAEGTYAPAGLYAYVVGPCESQFYALAWCRFADVGALRAALSRVCRCLCHVPNPYGYGKHVIACCDEARE